MRTDDSSFGLKHQILSPTEAIAQSLSSIAPTAGPTVLIPLVYALAGSGTWLAFLIAMCGVSLVAVNINVFARRSSSPGSIYDYVSSALGPVAGVTAGWALAVAYVGTAAAVTGGFTVYFNAALNGMFGASVPPALLTVLMVAAAWMFAYMNVQLSARAMLWLEVASVGLILVLFAVTVARVGLVDMAQLRLEGVAPEKLRLGLVLATFSFVGFESATALGAEVRSPLTSIPRAVISTAIFAGLFFVVSSYIEVLGFRGLTEGLGSSGAPLETLARRAGLGGFGIAISVCAVVSFFACTLACITAAARILFMAGRHGLLPAALGTAHTRNRTPHLAVTLAALLTVPVPVYLAMRGANGNDINGWLGTFATYGFVAAYFLVSVAAPVSLMRRGELRLGNLAASGLAVLFLSVTLAGNVYPVPPTPYNWILVLSGICIAAGPVTLIFRRAVPRA